jgi:hypothetical protein
VDSTAQWPLDVLERYGLTPRRVAVVLVGTTLALAVVIGVTRFVGPHLVQSAFNPDGELRIPALYSGMLLLLAAATALLSRHRGISFLLLAAGLAAMALDEVAQVHERLEARSGLDWQLIYIPAFFVALAVVVGVVRRMRRDAPGAVPVLAAGAACWVVSQLLEAVQWDGDVKQPGYDYMMFVEEVLEMLGTVGFIVSLLMLAWPVASAGRGTRPPAERATPSSTE